MRISSLTLWSCLAALSLGCGSLGGGGSKGDSPSAHEELSGLSAALQTQLDETAAPINETDSIVQQLTELPKTLNLSSDDYKDFLIHSLRGEPKLPEGASEDAKKQLNAFSKTLAAYKTKLFATPDKSAALVKGVAGALVKVPVLVSKIEASAQVTQANPLATKKEKKRAKQRSKNAKALGAQTTGKVTAIQKEAQGLPSKAQGAISKFTAALKAAGVDNIDAVKGVGSDTVNDAKTAAKETVNTAEESVKGSVDSAKSVAE